LEYLFPRLTRDLIEILLSIFTFSSANGANEREEFCFPQQVLLAQSADISHWRDMMCGQVESAIPAAAD